ncbi:MAG: acyl-CoA dehydrogenase [Acidimicrobiales bacterium]|nr:acyl-CoA dehydrogenase [Acidimicrobiales bacterium]
MPRSIVWGEGDFSVSVFHALSFEDERDLLRDAQLWAAKKAEHGYHAITWSPEYGGLGLSKEHARAFARLERGYQVPPRHETYSVTTGLIAPTVELFGTPEQKEQFVAAFLQAELLCCQLFSEPGAGSDLAALGCKAERDGDEWVLNGQKVWSSGAQFSEWGELIARSDPDAPKHKGLTAFLIPMDLPGIEIRPIKQMSGGTSFNEVFFNDCRVPDTMRLGPEGEGWKVALTTLGFERDKSGDAADGSAKAGGSWSQLLATAQAIGVTDDPTMRQDLMRVFSHVRVEGFLNRRAADLAKGGTPGPEGSLGKLMWTEGMNLISDVASRVLGPRLVADTGQWGTYAWGEHVLGAPGYRIAGGSDEVQRNIIGERVLGLPGEPRVDKGIPWKDVPR